MFKYLCILISLVSFITVQPFTFADEEDVDTVNPRIKGPKDWPEDMIPQIIIPKNWPENMEGLEPEKIRECLELANEIISAAYSNQPQNIPDIFERNRILVSGVNVKLNYDRKIGAKRSTADKVFPYLPTVRGVQVETSYIEHLKKVDDEARRRYSVLAPEIIDFTQKYARCPETKILFASHNLSMQYCIVDYLSVGFTNDYKVKRMNKYNFATFKDEVSAAFVTWNEEGNVSNGTGLLQRKDLRQFSFL